MFRVTLFYSKPKPDVIGEQEETYHPMSLCAVADAFCKLKHYHSVKTFSALNAFTCQYSLLSVESYIELAAISSVLCNKKTK